MKRYLLLFAFLLPLTLIAEEGDINERYYDGDTALIDAVRANDAKEFTRCLKRKADVNLADARGETPLMISMDLRDDPDHSMMKRLIKAKANVNAVDPDGKTALMKAAGYGYVDAIKVLIEAGADLNKTDKHGDTALMLAIMSNKDKTAFRLVIAKANCSLANENGVTALMLCANSQFERECGLLKDFAERIIAGSDVNAVDTGGMTALSYAAKYAGQKLASMLVVRGVDVDHVDINGDTPLLIAARSGNDDVVDILKSSKANLNARDRDGRSAIMLLCARGKVSGGCWWLIQAGANIDLQDTEGQTALIQAAKTGNSDVVSTLLLHEANPALKDKGGKTALDYAYARAIASNADGDVKCYELLKRAGKP